MNIFDYYHSSLLKGLKDFEKKGAIKIPEKTNRISVEVAPDKFDACLLYTSPSPRDRG